MGDLRMRSRHGRMAGWGSAQRVAVDADLAAIRSAFRRCTMEVLQALPLGMLLASGDKREIIQAVRDTMVEWLRADRRPGAAVAAAIA